MKYEFFPNSLDMLDLYFLKMYFIVIKMRTFS